MFSLKKIINFFKKDKKNNNYLEGLYDNLELVKKEDKIISFRIKKSYSKGFLIKTYGLYGFISFKYMPWHYRKLSYWKIVSKYLKNVKFFGQIHEINFKTSTLILNAESHKFKPANLIKDVNYEGVILEKNENYLIIDIGYDFNWFHGSIIGLIKVKKKLNSINNFKVGNIIQTSIFSLDNKNIFLKNDEISLELEKLKIIREEINHKLNNKIEIEEQSEKIHKIKKPLFISENKEIELKKLIGTEQNIEVKIISNNKKTYHLNNQLVIIPIVKKFYNKNDRKDLRSGLKNIENNAVLVCEIVDYLKDGTLIAKVLFD